MARQVHPRARVIAVAPLPGGITADMDRVTVASSRVEDVVLRRWPGADWADGLVLREAEALAALQDIGVPTPQLLATDEDGASAGVRCTLTSALPGQPDLCPDDLVSWLDQLASTQAVIHTVPGPLRVQWDGWYPESDRPLEWLADRGLRAAARTAASGPLLQEEVLIHGDYQHFNVLWCRGRLSGVVDWTNAAMGNRGSDVGHCRLNLAALFGPRAAAYYLLAYERAAGVRVDRRADLRALLCFTPHWQQFIPRQVAGRAPLDVAGMPDRVAAVVRDALDGIDQPALGH